MQEDKIVEEMRHFGNAYIAKFNFDLKAVVADLQQRRRHKKNDETPLNLKTEVTTKVD
jgi:hypothetical protein